MAIFGKKCAISPINTLYIEEYEMRKILFNFRVKNYEPSLTNVPRREFFFSFPISVLLGYPYNGLINFGIVLKTQLYFNEKNLLENIKNKSDKKNLLSKIQECAGTIFRYIRQAYLSSTTSQSVGKAITLLL
jgi:hypothetical protein